MSPDSQSRVVDAMTRVEVVLSPDSTILESLTLMEVGGFSHLPVTCQGRLVGMVAHRDLVTADLHQPGNRSQSHLPNTVDSVMARRPLSVSSDQDLVEVVETLFDHHLAAVPVVNEEQYPIGILFLDEIAAPSLRATAA